MSRLSHVFGLASEWPDRHLQGTRGNLGGGDSVWAMVFDQGESSDILDAIVTEGLCGTCGTPWDRV
jgi:hypothetical protein